ncbi:hypothetical protein [Lysobacter enzymogenes]|uniref:hypothetical protein n=1 Tax=Lysobacter enzymogenes TaxID=69 RepID=UPI001A95FDF9|nr:hypothetical protein [Lysobacter enzymogenes]QQP96516.1 hypothetical protein JHW38_00205 [Lysobacter enzymogenes]
MRYIVIVDASSFIGRSLLAKDHDGLSAGNPILDCAEIDMSHHYFFRAVRGPLDTRTGKTHLSLCFPHTAVLVVNEYDKKEGIVGFALSGE